MNNIKTLDEAIGSFDALATNAIALAALSASVEKRIAKLKTEHEAATAYLRAAIAESEASLLSFIESHQCLFEAPRKVKTSFGSFGLQTASELVLDDPDQVEKFVVQKKLSDCFEHVFRLVKSTIKKRIEAGEKIPGAKVNSGNTAVYKVEKTLIENARNSAA